MEENSPSTASDTSDDEGDKLPSTFDKAGTNNTDAMAFSSSSDSDLDNQPKSVYNIYKPFHIPRKDREAEGKEIAEHEDEPDSSETALEKSGDTCSQDNFEFHDVDTRGDQLESIVPAPDADTCKHSVTAVTDELDEDNITEKHQQSDNARGSEYIKVTDAGVADPQMTQTQNITTKQRLDSGMKEAVKMNHTDIITESMIADIVDDCEIKQNTKSDNTGREIIDILYKNDEDIEIFSTPTENLSENEADGDYSDAQMHIEEHEADKLQKNFPNEINPVIKNLEPNNPAADTCQFDASFVVIGKGTFIGSQYGYKSISSSLSDSDLQNTSESDMRSKADGEKSVDSDKALSVKDRISLFENTSQEKSHPKDVMLLNRDQVQKIETIGADCEDIEVEIKQHISTEIDEKEETSSDDHSLNYMQIEDNTVVNEAKSDVSNDVELNQPSTQDQDQSPQNLAELPSIIGQETVQHPDSDKNTSDVQCLATHEKHQGMSSTLPTTDRDIQSLESDRSVNEEPSLKADKSAGSTEMQDQSEEQRYLPETNNPGRLQNNTEQIRPAEGYTLMPNYQPYQQMFGNPSNILQFNPTNQPILYDPEALQRMTADPQFMQYVLNWQQFYQAQYMAPGMQSPSIGQETDTAPNISRTDQNEGTQMSSSRPSLKKDADGDTHSVNELQETREKYEENQLGSAPKLQKTDEIVVETSLRLKRSKPPVPKPRKSLTRVDKHSVPGFDPTVQPKPSKNPEQQAEVCIEEQPLSFSTENQSQDELRDERQVGIRENESTEVYIFVKSLNPKTSSEILKNYLESGAGTDAEVKENSTIFSPDNTEALVTFVGKPKISELQKLCNNRTLEGNRLQVCEVTPPTCIAVSSEEEIKSIDTVMLYFQLPKNGGGELATEEVQESADRSCYIIQFESPEVVKKVCDKERQHKVEGVALKVSPYYRCELGEILDSSLHCSPLPDPISVPPLAKAQTLSVPRVAETREKNSNNVFIFVKHLNPKTSSENLENYLEGGAGTDAEVKENSTLFSRDNTEALVTFVGKPKMSEMQKRCNKRTLDGSQIQICEVSPPTCIAVSSDEEIRSIDTVMLYFQLPKNGGGELATEEVQESDDRSCYIIQFVSPEVVKRLCAKERQHKVAGVTLKVSPYYRCELGEIWDSSLHCIPLPDSISVPLPTTKVQFLSRPCCNELKERLSHLHANIEFCETGYTLLCTLTPATDNFLTLARRWKEDVEKCLDTYLKSLYEETITMQDDVWEGIVDFLKADELSDERLIIEVRPRQHEIYLYGERERVEDAVRQINSVSNEIDRKLRRIHDSISLKLKGRAKILDMIGVFDRIEKKFTDLKITLEDGVIHVEGIPEDVTATMLEIHEENSKLVMEKRPHGYSRALVQYIHQEDRPNKVAELVRRQLEEEHITAEFELTSAELRVVVPPECYCKDAFDIIFDIIREEEIQLERESVPLLDDQMWEELREDITERYEQTVDISLNNSDEVVIIGFKDDVIKAKEKLTSFFEENTVKSECLPWDSLTRRFTIQYSRNKISEIEKQFLEYQVTFSLRDKDVLIKATKNGIGLAKKELKQLFAIICHKSHTIKKVGVTEVLTNIAPQFDEIEKKTRCVIDLPAGVGHSDTSGGATWYEEEDDEDEEVISSSVDEKPGLKTKNGLKIMLVKGELGKQEGSVIVCTTSQNLNLAGGAAGKSLLAEGGQSLKEDCARIIANQGPINHGEIVKIKGGMIECKDIYLTSLPNWKDDSSSVKVLEDIVEDCLELASSENNFSILFCAMGTGGLKYPVEEVATVMYKKTIEFDAANPGTSLKEVQFVLYQKDMKTIQAFENEERIHRFGTERVSYDLKFKHVRVDLVVEQLATQKVHCILCTTNQKMNLKASGACSALLAAGGPALEDDCKNNYQNNLQEGQIADITGGKMSCKSVYLTVLPAYTPEGEKILKDVIKTSLKLAQAKNYLSLACIALGTGYLNYPRSVAARCMYTAVDEYVQANPTTCIQQIKFVMHAKDRETIEAFRAYVQKSKGVHSRHSRVLEAEKSFRNRRAVTPYNAFTDGCQIRNITLKTFTGDILRQKTDGIVNSVTDEFKFIGGVASALKDRCPGLESESTRKASILKSNGICTTRREKHGGDLQPDIIIHVAFQRSLDKWTAKFRQCLEKAEKRGLRSLSFPVLGTGAGLHTFKPEDIAGCLFDAIDEFSGKRQQSCLKEVRLVVFHKQGFMMEPILRSLHKKTQAAVSSMQEKSTSFFAKGVSKIKEMMTSMYDKDGETPKQRTKEDISSFNIKIYSDNMANIDKCIEEVEMLVEEAYTTYTLSDYKELIQKLQKEEIAELEEIQIAVDMKLDQASGIITLKGPKRSVLQAQTSLHIFLKRCERVRQQTKEAAMLYQQIQWQYENVTDVGTELIPYDEMTNHMIENAYKDKKPSIELTDQNDKTVYVVDFVSLKEYIKEDASSAIVVVRKDILKSAKQPLPGEWMPMKEDENIRIVNLASGDPTYQKIEQQFVNEVTTGKFNNRLSSMKNVKVTKIDRIQNKTLYQQYAAKKELMMKQNPKPAAKFPIERSVWHGTSNDAVSSIQIHGFNRSYAGDKNGDPWFGNGVYFAADASYSARGWLSGASPTGSGTTKGYIFLVKALTGEFVKGTKGMRYLPAKNPSNPTLLYDCAVDDVKNPMEFVIFHDAQAYPEYLITFAS